MQSFDEASKDPQAHLVDTWRKTEPSMKSQEASAKSDSVRVTNAPAARKAMAAEWTTSDYAGMGI